MPRETLIQAEGAEPNASTCPACEGAGLRVEEMGTYRCLCEKRIAWETAMNDRELRVGDLVQTFHPTYGGTRLGRYPSSNYEITEIGDPCTCAPFVVSINNMGKQLPRWLEHRHIMGKHPFSGSPAILGAHLLDGRDAHNPHDHTAPKDDGDDYLLIIGERVASGRKGDQLCQMSLFGWNPSPSRSRPAPLRPPAAAAAQPSTGSSRKKR